MQLRQDTVSARVELSTQERSGFEVKSLTADFKMHPRAMEFARLDIKTKQEPPAKLFRHALQEL